MPWIRSHLSFANVISMIALFVALGGTTYAAVSLPKNSVGPKQIKKRAVRGKHINKNAVSASKIQGNAISSPKIADGTVFSADLGDNSVGSSEIAANAVGSSELGDNSVGSGEVTEGSLGVNDLQPGLLNVTPTVQFTQAAAFLAAGAEVSVDAFCPAGQIAIGGGFRGDDTLSEQTTVGSSRPIVSTTSTGAPGDDGTFTGWRASVQNEDGNATTIKPEVWVICVPAR
jgi:hypothetical protein